MSFIGDIERSLAQLWPLRVPIAIGLIAILAAIVFVAWRRGWHRVALAHPGTSVIAILLIIVTGGPIAWVLGSPLFIRTELVEDPPVAAAGPEATVLLAGEFVGADDFHFGEGQAELVRSASDQLTLSLHDLSVLNGPDLFVYLSPDPNTCTEGAINVGELKATDGAFSYDVPEGTDPADVASVIVWCRAFSALFATAALEPPSA